HALGGEQDVRRMGGLARKLPVTYRTFLIATLALAGIPPLAGFFSKDAILAEVFAANRPVLFGIGLVTAGLTAFYMFRLVSLTFAGEFRGTPDAAAQAHEAPRSMTVPLVVLALLSAVAGVIGLPAVLGERASWIAGFLAPVLPPVRLPGAEGVHGHLPHSTEWLLMGISVAVAVMGLLLAAKWYAKEGGRTPSRIAARFPALYGLVVERFRVDEIYDAVIVRPFVWISRVLWKVVDVLLIDGVLNAGAFVVELVGDSLRFLQTGNVRNYALTFLLGIVALLFFVMGGSP
ncbi:MAG: proton-conducting transporter membrane subunit, partial [Acidobacteriota bacterium]